MPVVFGAVTAFAVLGYVANSTTSAGVSRFFIEVNRGVTSSTATADGIVNSLNRLDASIRNSSYNSLINQTVAELPASVYANLQAESKTTREVTKGAQNTVNSYEQVRYVMVMLTFGIAMFSAFLGFGAGCCNTNYTTWWAFTLGTVGLVMLWFSFGVHLPASMMISDLCPEIDSFVRDSAVRVNPAVKVWVSCFRNESYAEIEKYAETGVQSTLVDLNAYSELRGMGRAISLNVTVNVEASLPEIDVELLDYETAILAKLDDGVIDDSEPFYFFITRARVYSRVLRQVQQLRACQQVQKAFSGVKKVICTTLASSVDQLMATTGLCALFLMIGVVLYAKAEKRLRPAPHRRAKPKNDEVVPFEDEEDNDGAAKKPKDINNKTSGAPAKRPQQAWGVPAAAGFAGVGNKAVAKKYADFSDETSTQSSPPAKKPLGRGAAQPALPPRQQQQQQSAPVRGATILLPGSMGAASAPPASMSPVEAYDDGDDGDTAPMRAAGGAPAVSRSRFFSAETLEREKRHNAVPKVRARPKLSEYYEDKHKQNRNMNMFFVNGGDSDED